MADLLHGYKELADVAQRPVRSCHELVATYPDPLPARRFRRGRVWARAERVKLWARRHPKKGVAPDPTLSKVEGWFAIARYVRLSVPRARQLAPWSKLAGLDPLPVFRDASGGVWAYRDALFDWLDRQSEAPASPRRRRKWERPKLRERKRGLRSEAEPEAATGDRARSGPDHETRVNSAKVRPRRAA